MKIRYLSPEGVLDVEQGALREIYRQLPGHWSGYAAFQLVPRNSANPLDVDLVVLTTNRVLLVELKNWNGDIEYSEGQWFHKGGAHKSPVLVTTNKVRVLEGVLRQKLSGKPTPIVDFVVVLCHPKCRLVGFPEEERRYTLTLADFCSTFSNPTKYVHRHPDVAGRPSPLDDRSFYETFFSFKNPQVKERKLIFHGFRQISSKPDYVHPRSIWEEFRAEHVEVRRSAALLRKWNFQALSDGATTAVERSTIGLRVLTLNERLRIQAPALHEDLLEPIAPATSDDLTTNFIEGYRLPERAERLSEFITRRADMAVQERVAISKVILARFSALHLIGVAHRDITTKTLWIVEPARVVLSSFAAARIPEARTVGAHRLELETGSTKLPEDVESSRPIPITVSQFARDVFLLGVLAYELIEGRLLETVSDVPLFDDTLELREARLKPWYAKAIDWEPASRYESAGEALDAFNELMEEERLELVTEEEITSYRTELSLLNLPMIEKMPSDRGKVVYQSELSGRHVLVKCWPTLRYDERAPARNARILSFLQQARSLRQAGFDAAPEVIDFGTSELGLILVTHWQEGVDLLDWLKSSPTKEQCGEVALSLINAVRRLHATGLSHGDLKASNVLVANVALVPRAVLLDVPDLSADGDEGVTPGTLPKALESATPKHRDAYTAIELALALLATEFPKTKAEGIRALAARDVVPPLDLLAEALQAELHPALPSVPEYLVTLRRRRRDGPVSQEFVGDDSFFPVGVKELADSNELMLYVTGLRHQMIVRCDWNDFQVKDVHLREISHEDYVLAARRAAFRLNATITLNYADEADASQIAGALIPRYEATRGDQSEQQIARPASSKDPYSEADTSPENLGSIPSRKLWEALTWTDELNAFQITLRDGARKTPEEDWLIPYDLDDGTLDFAEEERIEVLERGEDALEGTERWFVVGIVGELGKDLLRVRPTGFRFSPKQGKTYFLRGSLERSASEKRVAAMRRVLGHGALIPNLIDYFETELDIQPRETPFPVQEDLAQYSLNPLQEEALQAALRYGPVSLLQGPPGTGKTKFIASFVHYVLSTGLGKNILLVSQSHDAVNNALQKVRELATKTALDVSMVRIGLASMVSESLRPIQEDARRQSYRERFSAELKERVRFVGYSMGLPRDYVDQAIELQTSLGDILSRIETLETESEEEVDTATSNHIKNLRDRFASIAIAKFDWEIRNDVALREQFDSYMDDVASSCGAPSPDKRRRLDLAILLSTEFSHVLRNPRSNFTAFLARSAHLVAGTCVGVGKHALGIIDHAYDWVIVDEAARASPMELVVAMQSGRRVLLVGDHLQLPPTYSLAIQDKTAQILGISRTEFRAINSFQRAFFSAYGKIVGRTLLKQYRMAGAISRLVSHCFYDKALEVGRDPPGPEYQTLPGYLRREVVWLDTAEMGREAFHGTAGRADEGALVNEVEANLVVGLVREIVLNAQLVQHVRSKDEPEPIVGVITMYAAQRDLIRKKLDQADWASEARELFTVGTVDSYQGKENRVIILSVVRNDTEPRVGFLREPERINVAMSRAKDRLVIVSSTSMWAGRRGTPMYRVLDELRKMEEEGLCAFIPASRLRQKAADEATL